MYIVIGGITYSRISELSFNPEVDLTCSSLPASSFTARILTSDNLVTGVDAALYDDRDLIWANYFVVRVERISADCVEIEAQSPLALLDRWTVPAAFYNRRSVRYIVNDLLTSAVSGWIYGVTIDTSGISTSLTLTGFCPEQTARERLQWVCMGLGIFVKQCFETQLKLIRSPDVLTDPGTGTLIPLKDTYWKPAAKNRELVRSFIVTGYSVEYDEPASGDYKKVEDAAGNVYYLIPDRIMDFENDARPGAPGKVVKVDNVTLISEARCRDTLSRLSAAYFRDEEIHLSAINNHSCFPGQVVRFYLTEDRLFKGIVESCRFAFGLQAKAEMVVGILGEVE